MEVGGNNMMTWRLSRKTEAWRVGLGLLIYPHGYTESAKILDLIDRSIAPAELLLGEDRLTGPT
ncbi:MAG TPA: hypothetical protein VJP78_08945, partial [Thermoleophilia bacterium]|nr:hypothetical protein [Thermoleophilia bacterium]